MLFWNILYTLYIRKILLSSYDIQCIDYFQNKKDKIFIIKSNGGQKEGLFSQYLAEQIPYREGLRRQQQQEFQPGPLL
jgi:hypothetical protein